MKRFLTVLVAVALSGAIYVATAPGGQTASPTAAQFKALEKKVAKLEKDEKTVKNLASAEAALLTDCMARSVPIDQFGDAVNNTYGYSYTDPPVNNVTSPPYLTTGLDLTANTDAGALWITGGTSACGTDVNGALRKIGRLAGIHVQPAAPLGWHAAARR